MTARHEQPTPGAAADLAAMFGALVVMALAPWLDTSSVRRSKGGNGLGIFASGTSGTRSDTNAILGSSRGPASTNACFSLLRILAEFTKINTRANSSGGLCAKD